MHCNRFFGLRRIYVVRTTRWTSIVNHLCRTSCVMYFDCASETLILLIMWQQELNLMHCLKGRIYVSHLLVILVGLLVFIYACKV